MSAGVPAAPAGSASRVGLVLGPALFALLQLLPLPELSFHGQAVTADGPSRVVLGLTLWMSVWWMTEALPLAATSLLPLVVLPVGGVLSAKAVAPAYFDDTLALFLGGFCLALALERSGLHRRIALGVVRIVGTRPRAMVFGFLAASAVISMWVSNTATALMLMPVAVTAVAGLLPADKAAWTKEQRSFAACCVLAVAYGASIGGVGTLIGTPPNMILKRHHDALVLEDGSSPLTFARWILLGAPLVVVLVPVAWWVLVRWALPVPARLAAGASGGTGAPPALPAVGRVRFAEGAVLVVFLATAVGWITHQRIEIEGWHVPLTGWDEAFRFGRPASFVTDATVAVAAALLLFVLPSRAAPGDRLLDWEYVRSRLPWGALLLFGGGFSLAESFRASGVDEYLKAMFAGLEGMPPWALLLVVTAGVTAVSEVASNTATAAMLLPVLSAVADAAGMERMPLLLAVTLGASCGYALPVATMANTIAYGSGFVSPRQMGRAGLRLDVVAVLIVTIALLVLAPVVLGETTSGGAR
jgi:sodium-dependent dicarboxylate transporter 2/3/5